MPQRLIAPPATHYHFNHWLNRLTFDCWTFSGTQCWKVGQMPLLVTLLSYCWIRLSRAYRPRPTFAAFCVVVSANNYSTNAAGFPARNSRRRRRRRRKTNFRWRGAVVRRCCPRRRVCRSRGSYRSPPRVGWPPALHVRHQGNCGCDWNCRVARRPSIDAKATTQTCETTRKHSSKTQRRQSKKNQYINIWVPIRAIRCPIDPANFITSNGS